MVIIITIKKKYKRPSCKKLKTATDEIISINNICYYIIDGGACIIYAARLTTNKSVAVIIKTVAATIPTKVTTSIGGNWVNKAGSA